MLSEFFSPRLALIQYPSECAILLNRKTMKEILETTQLEYDKSTFLIDLVKNESGLLYLEIAQIIQGNKQIGKIKLKPAILQDFIKTLQEHQTKLPSTKIEETSYLSDKNQKKIQDRYLKGISINEIALQFDQSEDVIELILRNKGIRIVSNVLPKKTFWKQRRRK